MDGFDDLLTPTRKALEANPFADAFGPRSGSPDPWATPFGTHTDDGFGATTSAYEPSPFASSSSPFDLPSPTEPKHTDPEPESAPEKEKEEEKKEEEKALPADPLESAAVNQEDEEDNKPLGTLRSGPGFRESIGPSAILASREFTSPMSTIPESESKPKTTVDPPSVIQAQVNRQSTPVASPLEDSSKVNSLEASLGQLSLGRDILGGGGWHAHDGRDTEGWGKTDLTPTTPTLARTPRPEQSEEDSDDDRPISQTLSRKGTLDDNLPLPTPPKYQKLDNGIQPVFVVTVDDPQKVGDPIRPYTMYTVHTRTTSPLFQKSAFSVLRRYSDFVWLYDTLCANNPGVVVPPVPEKQPFGRFDDQFVRQRRLGLEKCIQKIANHPILGKDPDLRLFLESDNFMLEIKHKKSEGGHDRGGFMASIGQSLTGPRFHETDEWFDKQKGYLDSLESQLKGLAKSIEQVAKHRAEIAAATGEFAQSLAELSSSDVGKQLSHALGELAEVERKAQELQSTQSEQDISTFMATVDEYVRLINSVRGAFSSRIRTYYSWKNAENDLLRTKQTHEKNRAQGRIPPDRLGFSLSQIADAERRALDAKHEFDHVSRLVKSEVARFEQERIDDFKDTLHAFLEGMISRQKELISTWDNYQQILLKRVGGGGPAAASGHPVLSAAD